MNVDNKPSLCIPRILGNVDEQYIRNIFDKVSLGKIHHIDIINCKNEKNEIFKRAFIHFDKWYMNEDAQAIRNRLISGMDIKIVHEYPWFWKVSAGRDKIKGNYVP